MPRKSRATNHPTLDQVACYVKWLRLKGSKEYVDASQEMLQLREKKWTASDHAEAAEQAYEPFLPCNSSTTNIEAKQAQEKYWKADNTYQGACQALQTREKEVCRKFGLFMWWDPNDASITIQNAQAIVGPSFTVKVLGSPLDRMGSGKADKDGWLTLKVNLNVPLEESESLIGRLLRFYRDKPKTRNRPDKDAEALESWVCYEEKKRFSEAARFLRKPVSTVKSRYMRACELIYGERPAGSIKQRRVGIMNDPEGWFQAHLASCGRCPKADTPEEMCPKVRAYVTQETKALRERLR